MLEHDDERSSDVVGRLGGIGRVDSGAWVMHERLAVVEVGSRLRRERSMSMHTFVAIRYSHVRTDARPSNRPDDRHARTSVSCTASSASKPDRRSRTQCRRSSALCWVISSMAAPTARKVGRRRSGAFLLESVLRRGFRPPPRPAGGRVRSSWGRKPADLASGSLGRVGLWRRLRADLSQPDLAVGREERIFLILAPIVIVITAQLTDPGPPLDVLLLVPAAAAFVARAVAPRFPAEVFALVVLVSVGAAVGRGGQRRGQLLPRGADGALHGVEPRLGGPVER